MCTVGEPREETEATAGFYANSGPKRKIFIVTDFSLHFDHTKSKSRRKQ
jgi:hypothetical protein